MFKLNCNKMYFFRFIDGLMVYANQKLLSSIEQTPKVISSSIDDLGVFVRNTHNEIKNKLDSGLHIGVDEVEKDLSRNMFHI